MDLADQSQESDSSFAESETTEDEPIEAGLIDFQKDIIVLEQLKFQNQIYKSGQHIGVRTNEGDPKEIYGQIMLIGICRQAKFPLILVAWHYSKFQGYKSNEIPNYLSDKELISSPFMDWQYLQSIVRKITVMTLDDYLSLDYREREKSNIFFMRSHITYEDHTPHPQPLQICNCLEFPNPDVKTMQCILCCFQFHPMCERHQQLCINCQ